MRFRKREPLFSVLLDTGLHLLDSLRDGLPDNMDDIKGKVRDCLRWTESTYNSAWNTRRMRSRGECKNCSKTNIRAASRNGLHSATR
jgi:hypothetical protein